MNIFATIIGAIFEIYIGHMFFSKFGEKKVLKKTYYISLLSIGIVLIIASLTLVKSGLIIVASTTCFLVLSLLYDLKPIKKILLTFTLIITAALSEMIAVIATTLGIDTTIVTIQTTGTMYFVCIILAKFLTFAILKPIKISSYKSKNKTPPWFKFGTAVLPFTSAFIIVLLYRYSYLIDGELYRISTLVAAVLLILSNLLILFIMDKQEMHFRTISRLNFAESHIKNQVAHYSELYAQQEALKKFRHDSKNFYTSLISSLESMSTEDAVKYIKEKMPIELSKNNTVDSGHPVIDAIIYSKNQYAQTQNILINSDIKVTTPILIDELELGVLIGNALDNAIEAVEKLENNNQKIINLGIISSGDMLSIEVTNPTSNNINTNNLKTTKKDKNLHGYGLAGIETITTKYKGNLSLSCENNIFKLSSILVNIKNA